MPLADTDAVPVLQRGPQALRNVLTGIESRMAAGECDSVAQLKGSMSRQNLPECAQFLHAAGRVSVLVEFCEDIEQPPVMLFLLDPLAEADFLLKLRLQGVSPFGRR